MVNVDDTDNGRVHWRRWPSASPRAPRDHEHLFVHARAHAVDRQRRAGAACHRFSGCTSNSSRRRTSGAGVETTVPTTRAICIRGNAGHCISRFQVPVVDDPTMPASTGLRQDSTGLASLPGRRTRFRPRRRRRNRQRRAAGWRLAFRRQRLHDEQRQAGQTFVLASDDDVADHAGQVHQSVTSTVSTIPTIAASTGMSFRPDAIRAELPLTMRTVSPTPASTVSTATR